MAWEPLANLTGPQGPPGESGGVAIHEDPSNPGLYVIDAGLTEDPANPGLYLIGA